MNLSSIELAHSGKPEFVCSIPRSTKCCVLEQDILSS